MHHGRQDAGTQHRNGHPQRERHHRQAPTTTPHVVDQQTGAEQRNQCEQQRRWELGVDGRVPGTVKHPALGERQRRTTNQVVLGGLDQGQRRQQHRQVRFDRRRADTGPSGPPRAQRAVQVIHPSGGQSDGDQRREQPAEHVLEKRQREKVVPKVVAELGVGNAHLGSVEKQQPGLPGLHGG